MASSLPNKESEVVIGWIGLGSMGNAMATNIHQKYLTANNPIRFYNRTASRGDPLEALGGKRCNSVADLTRECNVIFISASDDKAVESIIDQILSSGATLTGKTILDTTTIHPDTTASLARRIRGESEEGRGGAADFAAIPVFGATPTAEAGQLLIAFSGSPSAFRLATSILGSGIVAREIMSISDEKTPEKSLLLKTTGNFLMAGLMQLIAEAHVFAEKTGLGSEALEGLLERNFGTVAHSDSVRMTTGVYMPGKGQKPWSDLELALKDVGHGVDVAGKYGVRLGCAEMALGNLRKAGGYIEGVNNRNKEEGKGEGEEEERRLDSSSLYGIVREEAGLDFRTDFVKRRDGDM